MEHIRALGKERSAKHYQENKEAILKKRREAYALKNNIAPKIEATPIVLKDLSHGTEKKYEDDSKRLLQIIGTMDALKKPKQVIELIHKATKRNGEPYSLNTKKSLFQVILVLIDSLKLKVNKKPYDKEFRILKEKSYDQNATKMEEIEVPDFKVWLKQIKQHFGMNSKEYLLARFYDDATVRDDLGLVISDKDMDGNYLLVKDNAIYVIINNYKTDKYGQIRIKLKKSLERLTRKYIENKQVGDLLFDAEHLSPFIVKMNKELGYDGGVNFIRHMKISTDLQDASPEERVRLAQVMKHSPITQKAYLRKLKLI